jgi:hypothetical protein
MQIGQPPKAINYCSGGEVGETIDLNLKLWTTTAAQSYFKKKKKTFVLISCAILGRPVVSFYETIYLVILYPFSKQ